MARDQRTLQKKRERREEKRKQARKQSCIRGGLPRNWKQVSSGQIADVLVPDSLFEIGIGNIWISRRLPDGRYAIAAFLLDVFCLGVKDVMYRMEDPGVYGMMCEAMYMEAGQNPVKWDAARARKLVERGVAYAAVLGFEPHEAYEAARIIFGDIDARSCSDEFVFGRDGKPCYISGPNDSPKRKELILGQLEKNCGAGNYDYLIQDGDEDEIFGTIDPF